MSLRSWGIIGLVLGALGFVIASLAVAKINQTGLLAFSQELQTAMGIWQLVEFGSATLGIISGALLLYVVTRKDKQSRTQGSHLCSHCGKYYDGNPKFCPNCGKDVERSSSSTSEGLATSAPEIPEGYKLSADQAAEVGFLSSYDKNLLQGLQYKRAHTRKSAAERLGALGNRHPHIINALKLASDSDSDQDVRNAAKKALLTLTPLGLNRAILSAAEDLRPRAASPPVLNELLPDFICPHCRTKLRTDGHTKGQRGRCPECGGIFKVPS